MRTLRDVSGDGRSVAVELLGVHLRRLGQAYPSVLGPTRRDGSRFSVSLRCPCTSGSPRFGLWLQECDRQGQLAALVASYLERYCGLSLQMQTTSADAIEVALEAETTHADVERLVGALEPALEALFHRRSDLLLRHFAGASFPAVHREAEGGDPVTDGAPPDATVRVVYEPADLKGLARLDTSLLGYDDRAATAVGRWLADRLRPFSLERRTVNAGRRRILVDHVCFAHTPSGADRHALEAAASAARGVEPSPTAQVVLSQSPARRVELRQGAAVARRALTATKRLVRCAVEQVLFPRLGGSPLVFQFFGADAATELELRAHWQAALPSRQLDQPPVDVLLIFPDAVADELAPKPSSVVLDLFGVLSWKPTPAALQSNILYARGVAMELCGAPLVCPDPSGHHGVDPELLAALLQEAVEGASSSAGRDALANDALQVTALRGFWGEILPAEWRSFQSHRRADRVTQSPPPDVTIATLPLAPREQAPLNVCDQVFCPDHLASSSALVAPATAESVTYAELRLRATAYARRFGALGLAPGDVVALAAPDGIDSVAILLGCLMGGWVFAPLNFHSEANLRLLLEAAGPKLVLYDPVHAPSIAAFRGAPTLAFDSAAPDASPPSPSDFRPVRVSPTASALILFTSGSTGSPKAVAHSHRDLLECSRNYGVYVLALTSADRVHTPSPLFFAYGLHNLMLSLLAGATHVLAMPKSSGARVAHLLAEYEITVLLSVPAVYKLLVSQADGALRLPRLRLCVSAGERLPPRLFHELSEFLGMPPLDGIGCTEALSTFISNRPSYVKADCTGVVVPGFAVRLLNERDELCGIGEVGTLWVRGGALTEGYLTDAELTSTTFVDGWFKTRDMFYYDADLRFFNVGRGSSTIKINACWFSAEAVEAVLQSHPSVKECVVGIVHDQYRLPRPKAFVVLPDSAKLGQDLDPLWAELRALCRARLGKDQYPHSFAKIDAVPRTASGKLMRSHPSLGQRAAEAAPGKLESEAGEGAAIPWT